MTDVGRHDEGPVGARDRARGALLGLACGDAVGFPALVHRTVRLGILRDSLWWAAARTDEHRMLRFPLPFTVTESAALEFSGTDDAEWAGLFGEILHEIGGDASAKDLEAAWLRHVVAHADEMWAGVSEWAAVRNLERGVHVPACGDHNPHRLDDSAVARAVPAGIIHGGDARRAAKLATDLASLTNAEDGVWAAAAMAAAVATAVGEASVEAIVEAARLEVPEGSWLDRNIECSLALLAEAGSALAAVPSWCDRVANHVYSYGTVAAETFPLALCIYQDTDGKAELAIPIAALVAKQSDSMPAMVGALCGATCGVSSLPTTWTTPVEHLRGVTLPQTRQVSLLELADSLWRRSPTAAGCIG